MKKKYRGHAGEYLYKCPMNVYRETFGERWSPPRCDKKRDDIVSICDPESGPSFSPDDDGRAASHLPFHPSPASTCSPLILALRQ